MIRAYLQLVFDKFIRKYKASVFLFGKGSFCVGYKPSHG